MLHKKLVNHLKDIVQGEGGDQETWSLRSPTPK